MYVELYYVEKECTEVGFHKKGVEGSMDPTYKK